MDEAVEQAGSAAASRTVAPRAPRCRGIAAVVERDSAAVCELAVDGVVQVRRGIVARNGAGDLAWDPGDPTSVAGLLETLLARARLPRRIDVLALSQSLFRMTCMVVPPVSGETLSALLAKRLAETVHEAHGEWLADSTPIGNPGDEEATSVPSVLAWAERATIERVEAELRARRIDVRRLVPPMAGLLNLLGRTRGKDVPGALLVVHVSLPSLCIFLFDGEDLLYVRPMRDALASAPEQLPEIMQVEVQRTAAYFRENQRGRSVEQVLVSGLAAESAERFCRWLSASVGSPCDPLLIATDPEFPAAIDRDALAAHLPLLAGSLLPSMRAHIDPARPLDLLPPRPRRMAMVGVLAALVLAGGAAAAWAREGFLRESRGREVEIGTLDRERSRLEAGRPTRADLLAQAQRHQAELQSLQVASEIASPISPVLESMLLVPPELVLVGARIRRPSIARSAIPDGDGRATLELRLHGDFTRRGPELVERLLRALETRPWCGAARAEAAGDAIGGADASEEVRVELTLR